MKNIYLIFLLVFALNSAVSQNAWQNKTIFNVKDYINFDKTSFFDEYTGYSIFKSKLIKTTNAGLNWNLIQSPTSDTTSPVFYCKDPNSIYISYSNTLYHSTNSGNSWNLLNTNFISSPVEIYFFNELTGFVNINQLTYKTTNGGISWSFSAYPSGFTNQLNYYVDQNKIFACDNSHFPTASTKLIRSENGGTNWIECLNTANYDNSKIFSVNFTDINNGIVVTGFQITVNNVTSLQALNIFITSDGGISWFQQEINILNFKSAARSGSRIEVACSDGYLYQSNDNGKSFSRFYFNAKLNKIIKPRSGTARYLCGEYNTIFKSNDLVSPFDDISSNNNSHLDLYSISFGNELTGFAVGEKGMILKSTDGGEYFFPTTNKYGVYNDTSNYNYVNFFNTNEGVIGSNSLIKLTINGGNTWSNLNLPIPGASVYGTVFLDKDHGMVRQPFNGNYCRVFYTSNGGSIWNIIAEERSSNQPGNYQDWRYYDFFFTPNKIYLLESYSWGSSVSSGASYVIFRTSTYQNISFISEISFTTWRVNYSSFIKSIDNQLTYYYTQFPSYYPNFSFNNGAGWITNNNCFIPYFSCGVGNNIYYGLNSGYGDVQRIDYSTNSYRIQKTYNLGNNWINSDSIDSFRPRQIYFVNNNLGFIIGSGGMILKTSSGGLVGTGNNVLNIPDKFDLHQNYPNPFNPVTKINFSIPAASKITLKIYDVLGREISVLINSELRTAGNYSVNFDGSKFSSGVYFYKLVNDDKADQSITKKMLLIK